MRISRFSCSGFRNLADTELDFAGKSIVFQGKNGQGKTNLIEAMYFLFFLRPIRSASFENLLSSDFDPEKGFTLRSIVQSDAGEREFSANFRKSGKDILLDGKKAPGRKDYVSIVRPLCFSPLTVNILRAAPSERRDFIDSICFSLSPDYYSVYSKFRRCLKQRNAILREISGRGRGSGIGETVSSPSAGSQLASLDEIFIPLSAKVSHFRVSSLKKAKNFLSDFIEGFEIGTKIEPAYALSSGEEGEFSAFPELSEIEVHNNKQLERLSAAEKASGRTLFGAHRDDFYFSLDGRDARFYSSQGEGRLILLCFFLAMSRIFRERYGHTPVMFLDDLFSELDRERRSRLASLLHDSDGQIFITGTDELLESSLSTQLLENMEVFKLEDGSVQSRSINI